MVASILSSQQPAFRGGGTPANNPPAYANLAAWWNPQSIPIQADNTALASWTDSIGGLVMAQATGANQPLYRVDSGGGVPGLDFTGNQFLSAASTGTPLKTKLDTLNYTIMVVLQNVTTQANATPFTTATTGSGIYLTATGGSCGQLGKFFQCALDTAGQFYTFGVTAVVAGLEDCRGYVNGCIVSQHGPQSSTNGTDFSIGRATNLPNNGLRGTLREILIWDRRLTPTEVMQFDDWARVKYSQPNPRSGLARFKHFTGDSITAGVSATNCNFSYPNIMRGTRGLTLGQWSNYAVGGENWTGLNNAQQDILDVVSYLGTGYQHDLAIWEWYNTRATALMTTVGVIQAYMNDSYAGGIDNITFGTTCDYGTAGAEKAAYTAYWDTPANQTGYMNQYVPIHLDANIGVNGSAAAGSGTYFNVDQIHLRGVSGFPGTPSGYPVLAGLFDAQMP